ncbi:ICE1 protein, partial [Amia calva]|nr:ICE1 protein [Amia calva]
MNPPVLACADTSTSTKSSSESIKKVRSAMGPPLPPLLPPLTATPPRLQRLASPLRLRSCRLSFPSPMDELVSPSDGPKKNSPCFATPSPSDSKSGTVSPLQFCAATPKHALPVPGRLPPSALTSSTSSPTMQQENSVRILDTMYPELSARARTLNILRGNVHLNRSIPGAANHVPGSVNQISGFKAINSSTTAFTKTGKACELENSSLKQQSESTPVIRKRPGVNMLLPRSAKKLRLDMDSPVPEKMEEPVTSPENSSELSEGRMQKQGNFPPKVIVNAFKKIEKACFDLLPVIKSHLKAGNVSRVPVLRDEERDVIKKFCSINKFKHLAEEFLIAILSKMKSEKLVLHSNHLQALCRVYVGICRQQGDLEKARLFAYSILKEDFPDSAKMVLFVISTWYNIFSFPGLINKAIQAVTRHRAKGDVLQCLTTYLDWEKAPPGDIVRLLSNTMIVLQMGVNMTFQYHDRHGEDLSPGVWEYIFALDLLCSQQHWDWTHDHFICKELWPIMDKWLKQGKRVTQHTTDISVAAVLRLIGRLGQLGMRERSVTSVKNVASVINKFGQHANAEGVPWAVQLAAVYAIYDLAPSNPKEALEALAAWRAETSHPVPPAVTSCITQIGSMCRQIR